MKTRLLLLLHVVSLIPCFSQSLNSEIHFSTRQGKLYTGLITELTDDSCQVLFETVGLSLSFANPQIRDINQSAGSKAAKQAIAFGDKVEQRLQQLATMRLGQLLQQCSFTEDATAQCLFRFSELRDCNLYLFYTTKGYDINSTDYHIVKIDLSAAFTDNPFSTVRAIDMRNNRNQPVVEIAKHHPDGVYTKEEFYTGSDWSNQPQYLTDLRLCFLNERQPEYQNAMKELGQTLAFLCQSCRKKK